MESSMYNEIQNILLSIGLYGWNERQPTMDIKYKHILSSRT